MIEVNDSDTLEQYEEAKDIYEMYYQDLFSRVVSSGSGSIRRVLDVGCGFGASTLALGKTLPNCRIVAVSRGQFPKEEVKEALGRRLKIKKDSIMHFLWHNKQPFDLINIARVENVAIYSSEEYDVLARNVNPGGYVVGMRDYFALDPAQMGRINFRKISIPGNVELPGFEIWQR